MLQKQWLDTFHEQLRVKAVTPGYIREETDDVVRHVSKLGDSGFIIASNLVGKDVRKIINEELHYFKALGHDFEWKVYSYDEPSDLMAQLSEQGFTIGDEEALLIMPLDGRFEHVDVSAVTEITTESGIQDLVALEESIWQESQGQLGEHLWQTKQEHPDKLSIYGVYEDGLLVSTAWINFEDDSSFASLWGGSTLLDYRGKGYYSQLLAIRAQQAKALGYEFLTVDASPMSRPILEKQGFYYVASTYECRSPR